MCLARTMRPIREVAGRLHNGHRDLPFPQFLVTNWPTTNGSAGQLHCWGGFARRLRATHQNQGGVVVGIASIDIGTFRDLFLANLQIPLTTSIAEFPKRLAEVQRVVILDGALLDQLLLIM